MCCRGSRLKLVTLMCGCVSEPDSDLLWAHVSVAFILFPTAIFLMRRFSIHLKEPTNPQYPAPERVFLALSPPPPSVGIIIITHWPLPSVRDLTRDSRLSTYDESVLKLSKISFWGKCAHARDTLKSYYHQQNSPGWVLFFKLSQASCHAGPVFYTISFLWELLWSVCWRSVQGR
jgi:hypothetical protein